MNLLSQRFFLRLMLPVGILLGLIGWLLPAQAPTPTGQELEALRREMQVSQRQREALQSAADLVPWRPLTSLPEIRLSKDAALVRLVNQMDPWRAVWIFEPLEGKKPSVRILLCWRGEQWIALAPGRWRVRLVVGRPDSNVTFRHQLDSVDTEKGKAYELALGEEMEQMLKERERAANPPTLNSAQTPSS